MQQEADLLNACIKSLSRTLNPVQSTLKGPYVPDPYGLEQQGKAFPGLYDTPKLQATPRDSEEFWMIQTRLVRECNRVSDALVDADARIRATLAQLK